MREDVVAMLTALGVTGAATDPLLDMVITNVQWRIKNLTNLREVPEGLESMAVFMAVGEYLNMKKANGQLEGFDLEAAVNKFRKVTPIFLLRWVTAIPPRNSGWIA